MNKSPFAYRPEVGQYIAKFFLPDDGTPDTEQWLEVVIGVDPETGQMSCHLYSCCRGGEIRYPSYELANSRHPSMDGVARALYGVARKRTIEVIEPIR